MSTEFVTHNEFELGMARIEARFDRLEGRMDSRFNEFEARTGARIEAAKNESIRWVVGIAMGQYALMFGLILFVVSRELPH
jgi:hypothetical protein